MLTVGKIEWSSNKDNGGFLIDEAQPPLVSRRDYFAGMALNALLSHKDRHHGQIRELTDDCFSYADSMLKSAVCSEEDESEGDG